MCCDCFHPSPLSVVGAIDSSTSDMLVREEGVVLSFLAQCTLALFICQAEYSYSYLPARKIFELQKCSCMYFMHGKHSRFDFSVELYKAEMPSQVTGI